MIFLRLNVRLKWPFRRIVAVAEFDFNPVEANQLPLKQGCQVVVLSKEGDHKGWWKGKIQDRVSKMCFLNVWSCLCLKKFVCNIN